MCDHQGDRKTARVTSQFSKTGLMRCVRGDRFDRVIDRDRQIVADYRSVDIAAALRGDLRKAQRPPPQPPATP
jgi:hypothetical protein